MVLEVLHRCIGRMGLQSLQHAISSAHMAIAKTVGCSATQVVGHTIQEQGINSACAEQVFRIDVGMSKGCGDGKPEVKRVTTLQILLSLTLYAASGWNKDVCS